VREPQRSLRHGTRDAGQLPVRKDIDLLAKIDQPDATGSFANKSFGNVIELGGESLILECTREFEVSTPIRLSMVFPGQPRGEDPFARLHCVVRNVHDWPNLHFDLQIVGMDEASHRRLELYLSQASSPERSSAGSGRS
jgi:hypothetical protein